MMRRNDLKAWHAKAKAVQFGFVWFTPWQPRLSFARLRKNEEEELQTDHQKSRLKVSNFQNEFMKSSFLPKDEPKIVPAQYSCSNITTTLIQISRLFYFGFFSKTNQQMMI